MPSQDYAAIARTVYDAFNKDEFDRALTYVSDEADIQLYSRELSFSGKEGFRQMMEFHKAAFPDGQVEVLWQLAGEDGVTNECLYHATHTRPLQGPGGEIPATGKRVHVRFCETWRFRDGKVVSLHLYADNLGVMQQLGVMPDPAAVGA